ncbi:MAG: hypothetical protein AAB870_02375, partial [Patescibacteria group bacterium]
PSPSASPSSTPGEAQAVFSGMGTDTLVLANVRASTFSNTGEVDKPCSGEATGETAKSIFDKLLAGTGLTSFPNWGLPGSPATFTDNKDGTITITVLAPPGTTEGNLLAYDKNAQTEKYCWVKKIQAVSMVGGKIDTVDRVYLKGTGHIQVKDGKWVLQPKPFTTQSKWEVQITQ